jgi:hypothetical protein
MIYTGFTGHHTVGRSFRNFGIWEENNFGLMELVSVWLRKLANRKADGIVSSIYNINTDCR